MTVHGRFSRSLILAFAAALGAVGISGQAFAADPGRITVQADKPGARFGPMFYGLMTEEINFSYDGGLYAELIQNRIFQNVNPPGGRGRGRGGATSSAPAPAAPIGSLAHWSVYKSSDIALDQANPVNTGALKTSARVDISAPGGGIANDGFWGIPVKPNTAYKASFYARAGNGFSGPLTASIVGDDGAVYATAQTAAVGAAWKSYSLDLKTAGVKPTAAAKFVVTGNSAGSVWLNLVSLFPPTFHNRGLDPYGHATGFRPDLMQLLEDNHPAFLRFPGGNYVEGPNFDNRFDFKITIGPWEERPGHRSPWNYRSSDGMGLLEFLLWCEDLKMEPILAVYAGLNIDGGRDIKTGEALKPLIQDALDEIEYVSGDATTQWGARRAKDGHPAPFKLTYVEVGNEDFLNGGTATYRGPEGRFAMFYKAIKAKYPQIQVIATTNPGQGVAHDVIDNHHYMPPQTAIRNAHLYDRANRNGPKIFEGEWASQEPGGNRRPLTPTFECALSDAAFLTGLERNADIVIMSCYAPLLTRVEPGGSQWRTNLIGYDALTSYGSPPYYVQNMFFNARGDQVLPVEAITPQPIPAPATAAATSGAGRGPNPNEPLFACASKEDKSGDIILKVVNVIDVDQQLEVNLAGATVLRNATGLVMSGQPADTNSIAEPMHTVPKPFTITDASAKWTHTFPGNSITVLRFKTR